MAANLQLVISAVDKASGTLGAIDQKAGGLTSSLKKIGVVGGVAAAAGIGLAVTAGIKFIQAAAEEEAGIKRLAAAVDANGGSWAAQGAQIEKVIQQRQKLAFSDDELRSSMALLTAQTGNVDEALRRQAVAMDFARGANIDLNTASKLLGKVTDENVNVLARYGIRAKEGMDATELLGLVQQKFAGQSAAFANTAAGRWQRFNIQMDNLKETIGAALLPIVTKLADKLSTWLEEHQDDIERVVQEWSTFAQSEVFPMLERAFGQLKQTIDGLAPVLEKVFNFFKKNEAALIPLIAALVVLAVVFGGPVTAIMALIAAGTLLLANWDTIRAKVEEIWSDFNAKFPAMAQIVELAFEFIRLRVQFYIDLVTNIIKIATALWHGDFGAAWEGIKSLFSDALGNILAQFKVILDGILIVAKEIMPLVKTAITAAIQEALDFIKSLPGAFEDAGKAIARGLLRGFKSIAKEIVNIDLNPTGINVPGVDVFGFQHGTPRVPRNMLAFLHAGEMVIPARPAERIRRGEAPAAFPQAVTVGGSSPFDYDRLAGALADALMGFGIDMDGERVGQLIERRLGARANLYGRAG